MSKKTLKPSVRIDGGKRTNLKARRERRGIVLNDPQRPATDPAKLAKARDRSRRQADRLRKADGGKDGTKVTVVKVRISGARTNTRQTMRCRPGTFEWRYGRNKQDALFHAGSHFAQLWERAGIAIASSADFLRGTMSGYATTISDSRAVAAQQVSEAVREIGRFSAERLVDYCVLGETTAILARKHGQPDRDMAAVLHQDLRACAMHFNFV